MSEEESGGAADGKKEEPQQWQEKAEDNSDTIRESVMEGDGSSEYIQGAILEASKSEMERAKSAEEQASRFQIWLAEWITEHDGSTTKLLSKANPRNYDRLDWIFAFSFVVLLAGTVVMFQTTSTLVASGSLVVMFLSFVSMLLCAGIEDILKEGYHKVTGKEAGEETEAFDEGESME
jgi:hypothetical protein